MSFLQVLEKMRSILQQRNNRSFLNVDDNKEEAATVPGPSRSVVDEAPILENPEINPSTTIIIDDANPTDGTDGLEGEVFNSIRDEDNSYDDWVVLNMEEFDDGEVTEETPRSVTSWRWSKLFVGRDPEPTHVAVEVTAEEDGDEEATTPELETTSTWVAPIREIEFREAREIHEMSMVAFTSRIAGCLQVMEMARNAEVEGEEEEEEEKEEETTSGEEEIGEIEDYEKEENVCDEEEWDEEDAEGEEAYHDFYESASEYEEEGDEEGREAPRSVTSWRWSKLFVGRDPEPTHVAVEVTAEVEGGEEEATTPEPETTSTWVASNREIEFREAREIHEKLMRDISVASPSRLVKLLVVLQRENNRDVEGDEEETTTSGEEEIGEIEDYEEEENVCDEEEWDEEDAEGEEAYSAYYKSESEYEEEGVVKEGREEEEETTSGEEEIGEIEDYEEEKNGLRLMEQCQILVCCKGFMCKYCQDHVQPCRKCSGDKNTPLGLTEAIVNRWNNKAEIKAQDDRDWEELKEAIDQYVGIQTEKN